MDLCFGERVGGWFQAKMKPALIPNMMYLPRAQARTQLKSDSLQSKGRYNQGKTRKVARNMLVVRQQIREGGMELRTKGF